LRVNEELTKLFKIKKLDLFLDYFNRGRKEAPWLKIPFWRNKKRLQKFGKIYEAEKTKVSERERKELIKEFVQKLQTKNF